MLIPYSTDAPIYHFPAATLGLILVNTLLLMGLDSTQIKHLSISFGGFYPWQWLTANFMHAGLGHLIGNMIFLWAFGLIVEGKLGWWRFLLTYAAIGTTWGAVVQVLELGGDPTHYALGASGAIYGLLAMCLIWAPLNNLSCLYFFSVIPRTTEFSIGWFATLYIFLELLEWYFGKPEMSTPLLHLIGAAAGAGIAVTMLRLKLVDCENWDVFSVLAGRHQMSKSDLDLADHKQQKEGEKSDLLSRQDQLYQQIEDTIAAGQPQLAYMAHKKMAAKIPGWKLPPDLFYRLLAAFWQKQAYADSIPAAVEYLKGYQERTAQIRLKLAQVLVVHENRPGQALRVLSKIPVGQLNPNEQEIRQRIEQQAHELRAHEDYLEIGVEDW